ncbi:MAG TPA: hypothetical protein VN951_00745 [Pyrinomonadaceae bacterium]|nr:hypothetical protein [Pyrinomonadaceae bacterium]
MSKTRSILNILGVMMFIFAVTSLAQAQATRTWVSGVGDDANPCSRTAPCKTFAGAISKTADGGEIDCVDSGGFGTVTITKSITIDGAGVLAGILAAGTNGVNVNDSGSGAPQTKIVRLRNLSINGAGTGINGVNITSARAVYIESCVITGFKASNATTSDGIEINFTAGSGTFNVSVKDTIIENNSGDGIRQSTTVGTLNCYYDNVVIAGNLKGLEALGGTGNLSRSVVDNNSTEGVSVNNGAVVNASSNLVTSNGNGFNAISGTIRLGNNNVFRNTSNAFAGGGTYVTFGNNNVAGNTGNEALPAATAPK